MNWEVRCREENTSYVLWKMQMDFIFIFFLGFDGLGFFTHH